MGPLRMRRAMGSQADNAIPKCCNTWALWKGWCTKIISTGGILMSAPRSHHCVVRTSGSASEQVMLRVQHLHSTHFWGFKFPFHQKISSGVLWTGCHPLVWDWDAAKVLLDPFHRFSFTQSDLIHLDVCASFLETKQSTGWRSAWEFLLKRALPIWAGIELCDAAAGLRSPSQTWAVQCSSDTKEKMQEPFSQFIKSLLTQIDSSASVIDVNQILIHEHRINMVAHFTPPTYSVWLFIQTFVFKRHKTAIEDFRLLLV